MRVISVFVLLTILASEGNSQISIGGREGNIIYSSVKNEIQYLGTDNCENLKLSIEGYKEKLTFQDCIVEVLSSHLEYDTSRIEIRNEQNEILYDTFLIKKINNAKLCLQIGTTLVSGGTISKSDLKQMNKVRVVYDCPWAEEAEVYGFTIITLDKKRFHTSFKVKGSKILDKYLKQITKMRTIEKIYIEQVDWRPLQCFESLNSMMLNVK